MRHDMPIMRAPKTPTIRANLLASLVAELAHRGVDAVPLLQAHIEGVEAIDNPYDEVALDRYVAFFEAAAAASGDPLFGARAGARFRPEDLGPLGVVFVAAPSLRSALGRLGVFLRAWQGGTSASLEVEGGIAEWSYRIDDEAIRPRRQDSEFTLSATCGFIRSLLGPGWAPVEVHFEHSPGPDGQRERRALEAIFNAPVLFEKGLNRIAFDAADLDRPVSNARQAMAPYLERHLRDLMGEGGPARTWSDLVGQLIAWRIGRQPTDVKSLAEELGVSARTLQRRLAEEGASLRGLVRAHRQRLAEPVLSKGSAPITTIADLVGYADPTVFSRAFRTWRGSSPREFRQRSLKP
jgi:AraC-like DNA-binding protein